MTHWKLMLAVGGLVLGSAWLVRSATHDDAPLAEPDADVRPEPRRIPTNPNRIQELWRVIRARSGGASLECGARKM